MNNTQIITVEPDSKIWSILDKEDDRSCILKNLSSGEEIEGKITSISSRGIYTIEVIKK